MSGNRVVVDLTVKDLASSVFGKFKALVSSTEGNLAKFGRSGSVATASIGSGLTGAVLTANLLTAGIGLATSAIANLGSTAIASFTSAADAQMSFLTTVSGVAAATGESYAKAKVQALDLAKAVELAGNAYPVDDARITGALNANLDDIIEARKKLDGGVNQLAIEADAKNILPRLALMAQSANVNASEAGRFTTQFLQGNLTNAQFKGLDFFSQNKVFSNTVLDQLKRDGKDLKALSDSERYKLLQAGLNAQVTPEFVKDAQTSVNGIISTFTGSLFGEQTGLLSLVRDIDGISSNGSQSVIAAVGDALNTLFGNDGILYTLAGIVTGNTNLNDKSFLQGLRSGILGFNEWLKSVNGVLKGVLNSKGDFGDLGIAIEGFFKQNISGLGDRLGAAFNRGVAFLNTLDWSAIGAQLGLVFASITNEAAHAFGAIDWSSVALLFFNVAGGAVSMLGTWLGGLDWGIVLKDLLVGGVLLVGAGIVGSLGAIPLAFGVVIAGLISIIANNWAEISAFWVEQWQGVVSGATAFYNNLQSGLNSLSDSVLSWFASVVSNLPVVGGDAAAGIRSQMTSAQANPTAAGSRYEGYVPNAANGWIGGILRAAIREGANMPSGAGVMVANTSEAVLTSRQQANLARSLAGRSSGGLSIGNLNVSSMASDPKAVAREVMNEISRQFASFEQNQLTAIAH